MELVRLGKTDLMVSRVSFGALPIQRRSFDDAKKILLRAFDGGINFYDTARFYTDSEAKLGYAFSGMRKEVLLASKSMGSNRAEVLADLEASLRDLKTDYLDLFQLHNPTIQPDIADPDSNYAGLVEAKKKGMVRHIGVTNHSAEIAQTAIHEGVYETLQYLFCCLATELDESIVRQCREKGMGFIAMKGFGGGSIRRIRDNFAYIWSFENVVPIYGMQHMHELEEILALAEHPPAYDQAARDGVAQERRALAGGFCRGCAYCEPYCPKQIPISDCARMELLLKRASVPVLITKPWQEKMEKAGECIACGQCTAHCPYHLDTPALLKRGRAAFQQVLKERNVFKED